MILELDHTSFVIGFKRGLAHREPTLDQAIDRLLPLVTDEVADELEKLKEGGE